jgi:hypothetical protein
MCQLYVCGHAQWKAPFQVSTVPLYADCLFVGLFVCLFVHRAGGRKTKQRVLGA